MCLDQLPFLEPEGIVGLPFISFGLPSFIGLLSPHISGMSVPQPTLPYKIWEGRLWYGQTVTRPILSCIFGIAQDMKSHLLVCQTDSYVRPPESKSFPFKPTYYSFYTHQVFSESNLSAPLRFWAAKVYHRGLTLRSEIYFLQILPCHARVIGKKDRTYKHSDDWKPQHKFRTSRTERSRRQGKICVTH